jgi:protein ImuA
MFSILSEPQTDPFVAPSQTVEQLRAHLRRMRHEELRDNHGPSGISMGIPALDALVSPSLFRPGMIVEWVLGRNGTGGSRLAAQMIQQVLATTGTLVVIDERREFYPPAASRLGIDLARTVVVRPHDTREALWALEQALRCRGVAATWAWVDQLPDRNFRRLQLAAEQGRGVGILIRPSAARQTSSWADLRWFVQTLPGGLRVELLHCREGFPGGAVNLERDDETGNLRVVSPLAAATSVSRATGA